MQAAGITEGPIEGPFSAEEEHLAKRISTHVIHQTMMHSGPLPAPETLGRYENILPDSAERILVMAEKQSDHRQAMERTVILSNVRDQGRGVVFAFTLA